VPRDREGTFEPVIVRKGSGGWAVLMRLRCRCTRKG
jgi:hypothetical protein